MYLFVLKIAENCIFSTHKTVAKILKHPLEQYNSN